MKQLYLIPFFLISLFGAFAQPLSISGKVVDSLERQPLPGAHVTLTLRSDQTATTTITDETGAFRFENVTPGRYRVHVSFLGFRDLSRAVEAAGEDVRMGRLQLSPAAIGLGEVEVREQGVIAVQKGDTTEYNAGAFKTLPDASAEELVSKMPTVTVENGQVQAQGETVQQVLVDGRPFFGNDPTAALRNLPAEVIDKIQIFDQQSDQAQFTGFDDGEAAKTINIITRPNMRNGQFGKLYAGYGYEERYDAGGNVSLFNGDQRISVIGMSNNVNQQNFGSEDLLGITGSNRRSGRGGRGGGGQRGGGRGGGGGSSPGDFMVDQQGGIATTHAVGLNYSDRWGEKLDITGSYFFNWSDNDAVELLTRNYVGNTDGTDLYNEANESSATNSNHRLNARLEYEFDESNSLIWRPRGSWQMNDGLSSVLGRSYLGNDILSQTKNDFRSDLFGLNFNNNLLYRHRFAKPRRTFSINISSGYAPKKGESYLLSESFFISDPQQADTLDQFSSLDLNSWNLAVNLSYTEPVGKNSMLMFNYRSSWQQEASDKYTYDFDEEHQEYDLLNEQLSNVFSNDYFTQLAGAGYNYRKGEMTLMARGEMQWAQLDNEQSFPKDGRLEQTFVNFLPMVMLRYNFSRRHNLRVSYRTNTDLPGIAQLQNVVDNSNPLQLTAGNPALKQSYGHRIFARYSKTNTEKSTVFFALISGSYTDDHISSSTYTRETDHPIFEEITLEPGAQLTLPVNLDGYWTSRAFLTYGFPVKAIKSNLNIDLTGNYARLPGLINDELNYSNNATLGIGLTLSSNISDRVDFALSSRSGFNQVTNSLQTGVNNNYFNQNTRLRLNWIFVKGFVFRNDLIHQFYDGLSEGFDQNYWLWNIGLGKKFLKDDRGELTFFVFDLLKQNAAVTRNVTDVYVEDVQTNVLQQYFMLKFTYNLRNFQVKK